MNRETTPTAAADVTLGDIEKKTKAFSDARKTVIDLVNELNELIQQTTRERMPAIKRAIAITAEKRTELEVKIQSAPNLFVRPRTLEIHGIKVGYAKGKGKIEWEDDDYVVRMIEKHLPKDQHELLIKTTKKPISGGIKELNVTDLKKIGCTVEETGDYIMIKPIDTEVDKLVKALLKDAIDAEQAAKN